MPKVYIPNAAYHDFTPAKAFGTLVPVTEGRMNTLEVGAIYRTFKEAVDESDKEDFILITGPSVMCSILCSLFSLRHGKLNLLIYTMRGGDGEYKVRRLHFNPKENLTN